MLKIRSGFKIFCSLEPIDMRKAIDGLNIIITEHEPDDRSRCIYIFRNKDSNKVKILFWDQNGYVLYYKRLERKRFKFPMNKDGYIELTDLQLKGLLCGLEFELLEQFNEYDFSAFD